MGEDQIKEIFNATFFVTTKHELNNQILFIKNLLVLLSKIGLEKRENESNFDIGFKLGEIYRMIIEFLNDSENLKSTLLIFLDTMEEKLKELETKKENSTSEKRILLD